MQAPEAGSPATIAVDAAACTDVSADRIAELLAIEHPDLQDASGLRVTLACEGAKVTITLEDAVTAKTVERKIDAPPPGSPGRQREIALATSSLIVASWLELTVPPEERHPPPAPETPQTEAARRVVADTLQPPPRASMQLVAGVRWRDLPRGPMMLRYGLRAGGFVHRHWEIFGQAAFEHGRAVRDRGQVGVVAVLAGPGVAWHLRPSRPVGLEIHGTASVGWARLSGRTSRDDVDVGALGGITGDFEVGIGPRFRAHAFVVAIDLQAGWALPTPRGTVTAEDPVTFGGPWAGIGVRAGGLLGQR